MNWLRELALHNDAYDRVNHSVTVSVSYCCWAILSVAMQFSRFSNAHSRIEGTHKVLNH